MATSTSAITINAGLTKERPEIIVLTNSDFTKGDSVTLPNLIGKTAYIVAANIQQSGILTGVSISGLALTIDGNFTGRGAVHIVYGDL